MRTEQEVTELILKTAREDSRILAVILEGSRVNPEARKDIFQDYDIVYVTEETRSFREDKRWIDRFGERLYMQFPEDFTDSGTDLEQCYGWLMQFVDGIRIDLHVCTLKYTKAYLQENPMYRVLLDKTGKIPQPKDGAEQYYWIQRPSQRRFAETCNEFWWCLNNVAKGLWRKEIPYVMEQLDDIIRPMLLRLLEWKIGAEQDFCVSVGKAGKYLKEFLSEETYEQYLETYCRAKIPEIWTAVFTMCGLFRETAKELEERLNLTYNEKEGENSRRYLEHISTLSEEAEEIYP